MSEKLVEKIVDLENGIETIREYTAEEIEEVKKSEQVFRAWSEELKNKEMARKSALAKLAALGLTEDEIAAL